MESIFEFGRAIRFEDITFFGIWRNEIRAEEIKAAIKELPGADFIEIRKWVADRDWQIWDWELEADSKAGRLDFLVKETFAPLSSFQEDRRILISKGGA